MKLISSIRHILIGVILGASLLVACDGTSTTEPDSSSEPTTIAEATEPTGPIIGTANVEKIELLLLESFPVQVNVVAEGTLPDGCTQIDDISQTRSGALFEVVIKTSRQAADACTTALAAFEETIALDVLDIPAGTYAVNVNGISESFILSVDNSPIPPTEVPTVTPVPTNTPTPEPTGFFVNGTIFHDLCAITGGEGGATAIPSAGCVAAPAGGFVADGVRDSAEPPLVGLRVDLYETTCESGTPIASANTDNSGNFEFTVMAAGTFCLTVDALSEPNASILIPGQWTTPNEDGELLVDISADTGSLLFGWDYQFLPVAETVSDESCIDIVTFGGDRTIPDDTPFEPGDTFIKTWNLINTGNCTWNERYALLFANGEQMEAPIEVNIDKIVVPGDSVNVSVELTAPLALGTYRGDWTLRRPNGEILGLDGVAEDTIWLQIQVIEAGSLAKINGLIWDDVCDSSNYTFGVSTSLPQGCVENLNATIRADGVFDRDNEQPIPAVEVTLGQGECGEAVVLATTQTNAAGEYSFNSLFPDTYCIYIEVLSEANIDLLLPGTTSFPTPNRTGITVTVAGSTTLDSINFGWDFAE